jgi:hypothetical protein
LAADVDADLAATWLLTRLLTWLIGDDVDNDEDADIDFLRGIFICHNELHFRNGPHCHIAAQNLKPFQPTKTTEDILTHRINTTAISTQKSN